MVSTHETFRIKIAARRQITLPEQLLELLRIDEGDTLEICVDRNVISGGCGLKLMPTSLFDEALMARLREREREIALGSGIKVNDAEELAVKLGRKPVLATSGV